MSPINSTIIEGETSTPDPWDFSFDSLNGGQTTALVFGIIYVMCQLIGGFIVAIEYHEYAKNRWGQRIERDGCLNILYPLLLFIAVLFAPFIWIFNRVVNHGIALFFYEDTTFCGYNIKDFGGGCCGGCGGCHATADTFSSGMAKIASCCSLTTENIGACCTGCFRCGRNRGQEWTGETDEAIGLVDKQPEEERLMKMELGESYGYESDDFLPIPSAAPPAYNSVSHH